MKTSLVIKLIIIIAVLAGLGYILYKDYYKNDELISKINETINLSKMFTL